MSEPYQPKWRDKYIKQSFKKLVSSSFIEATEEWLETDSYKYQDQKKSKNRY